MNIFSTVFSTFSFLLMLAGAVFLQKWLTKKHVLLGLVLPLISLCYSGFMDFGIISMIVGSRPRTIEKYNNGLLVSRVVISNASINIPGIIFVLIISNLPTILLFAMYLIDCKKIKCKKELNKMKINDLA